MRYARRVLVTALITASAQVAVALLSAARLADAPARGRLAGPDPLGSIASVIAALAGLAAFMRLGGSIAVDSPSSRPPIIAGAIGGALAGLVAGSAQSVALADYLGAVLAGYAVPTEFLVIALGAYLIVAGCAAAAVGAAVTYAGWHRARRADQSSG